MATTSNARLIVVSRFRCQNSYSRKFDEFPDISRNDEKARLDNFGIELQNDPTATAYVVVYPGRSSKRGDVQHHASRIVEYLVHSRGLDQRRIVTLVGPARDQLFVELWVTPQGATPPNSVNHEQEQIAGTGLTARSCTCSAPAPAPATALYCSCSCSYPVACQYSRILCVLTRRVF